MAPARAISAEYKYGGAYAAASARSFHRAATAALLGPIRNDDPTAIAKQVRASDQDAHVVLRAVTSPSTTTSAAALVRMACNPQVLLLRRVLNVDLGQGGAIVVPGAVAKASDSNPCRRGESVRHTGRSMRGKAPFLTDHSRPVFKVARAGQGSRPHLIRRRRNALRPDLRAD